MSKDNFDKEQQILPKITLNSNGNDKKNYLNFSINSILSDSSLKSDLKNSKKQEELHINSDFTNLHNMTKNKHSINSILNNSASNTSHLNGKEINLPFILK